MPATHPAYKLIYNPARISIVKKHCNIHVFTRCNSMGTKYCCYYAAAIMFLAMTQTCEAMNITLGCRISLPSDKNVTVNWANGSSLFDAGKILYHGGEIFPMIDVPNHSNNSFTCQLNTSVTSHVVKNDTFTLKIKSDHKKEVPSGGNLTWPVEIIYEPSKIPIGDVEFFLVRKSNFTIIGKIEKGSIDAKKTQYNVIMTNVTNEIGGEHYLVAYAPTTFNRISVELKVKSPPVAKITEIVPSNVYPINKNGINSKGEVLPVQIFHDFEVNETISWYFLPCKNSSVAVVENCDHFPPNITNLILKTNAIVNVSEGISSSLPSYRPKQSGILRLETSESTFGQGADERAVCVSDAQENLRAVRSAKMIYISCEVSTCSYNETAGILWYEVKGNKTTQISTGIKVTQGMKSIKSVLIMPKNQPKIRTSYQCHAQNLNNCKHCQSNITFSGENELRCSVALISLISAGFFLF